MDRRFHRQPKPNRYNQPSRPQRRPRCFICKKEGCWSSHHSAKEQEDSKARFRARNQGRLNTRAPHLARNFDKTFRQYLATYEGNDDSEDEALEDTCQALTVDTNDLTLALDPDFDDFEKVETQEIAYVHITDGISRELVANLANRATVHSLTATHTVTATPIDLTRPAGKINTTIPMDAFTASNFSRYSSDQFYGIMIDTGASKHSTAGYRQFQALQHLDMSVKLDYSTEGMVTVQFGIGTTASIESALVSIPIGQVQFHVVQADTPFLLSLADMDSLQVYFNNLLDVLTTPNGDIPVVHRFGHSFLLWDTLLQHFLTDSFDSNPCYLTSVELQRLHRRFGHSSVDRLYTVLNRAGHEVDKKALDQLTCFCTYCQKYGRSPGRFKFTLQNDDISFNYCILVDIIYINLDPVLHIVN